MRVFTAGMDRQDSVRIDKLERASNNVLAVTLEPGATQTTVKDARFNGNAAVLLVPRTQNALAAAPTTLAVPGNNEVVIQHANNSQTDRTFHIVLFGFA